MQDSEWLTKGTDVGGVDFGTQRDAGFVHPVRHALRRDQDWTCPRSAPPSNTLVRVICSGPCGGCPAPRESATLESTGCVTITPLATQVFNPARVGRHLGMVVRTPNHQ